MYIVLGGLVAALVIAAMLYFVWESAVTERRAESETVSPTAGGMGERPPSPRHGVGTHGDNMRTFDRQPDRAGVERPLFARRAKPPSDEEIEYRVYARPRSETGQRWDPFAEEQSRVHRVRTARHRPSTLPDYYKLLGLERGATDEQVERAYRRRAARIHPDRFHNDAEGRAAAEAQLKELNRAMQILRDPTRRAQYDAML